MGHHKPKNIPPYCLNCHYPISEFDHNCSQCGQKPTDGKTTLHDLWHEFIHTKLHLDGKFFTTLRHIFVPGKLTEEFFKGHHKRYAHPVQLFLVLGGLMLIVLSKMAYKSEAKLSKDSEERLEKMRRVTLFQQLDSAAQTMSFYKDSAKRQEFENFLEKQFVSDKAEFENTLNEQWEKKRNQIGAYRETLSLINQVLSTKNLSSDSIKIFNQALIYYQFYYKKYQKDSVLIEEKAKKFDIVLEKKAAPATDSLKKSETKKKEKGLKITFVTDYSLKLEEAISQVDMEEMTRDSLESSQTYTHKIYEPENDSFSIMRINDKSKVIVAEKDIYTLSTEEIVEKYHPEGFWAKLMLKQSIKTMKDGGSALHAIIKNMFYIFIASLLPMAFVLWVLYRRQKRFYVEHLVFLMHYNCLGFILMPLLLFEKQGFSQGIYALILVVALFLAMKKYYKQSWRKTIVKGILANIAFLFIGIFIVTLGIIVSVALF